MLYVDMPRDAEVQGFVYAWFRLLDRHAPLDEVAAMLAASGLEVRLPEVTVTSREAFARWYEGVIRTFFDEAHELKAISATYAGDGAAWRAHVRLVVRWAAKRWNPPAAESEALAFDVNQRWVLRREPGSGELVIEGYVVDRLEPLGGSAPL